MRRDYETISRRNEEQLGKDRRSRMSQVAMYADTAHFVYELLQNADDAGATEILFELSAHQLVIEHDGKPFDEQDVQGISYFGKGKTDVTAIGHFGLGFKSVFAYTASPRIHSMEDDFELVDLYTVRAVERPKDLPPNRTRFVLAFDHHEKHPVYIESAKLKKPAKAQSEIGEKLRALGGAVLLFTKSLRQIRWADSKGSGQYRRRDTPLPERGRETVIVTGQAKDQTFIVLERPVLWPDDRGNNQQHRPIALAAQLDKSHQSDGRVIGSENQPLWVFFPTSKETHLGLIIQGPYRTTPARDNIPADDDFNEHLVSETAPLLIEALVSLKELRVLDADLLTRLPIDETSFPKKSFLRPLYDATRKALRADTLLPSSTGGWISASHAKLARGQRLTEVFDAEQLSTLFGRERLEWLVPSITAGKYPALYTYFVGRKESSWDREWLVPPLVTGMEVRVEDIADKLTASFMNKQSDAWVGRFYRFLHERRGDTSGIFLTKPFLRLEDGKHVEPFRGLKHVPNAFLPGKENSDLPTIKRVLVSDPTVLEFLMALGLTVADAVDEVMAKILPRYKPDATDLTVDAWKKDITKILGSLHTEHPEKRTRLVAQLADSCWVLTQAPHDGSFWFTTPARAYIRSEELDAYFADFAEYRFLPEDHYTSKQIEQVERLGTARLPRVTVRAPSYDGYAILAHHHGWHKRGVNGFDPDWTVEGLVHAAQNSSVQRATFMWNKILLSRAHLIRGSIESSTRQTFETPRREDVWSATGEVLRDTAWLPNQKGQLVKPGELLLSELPTGFDRESLQAKRLAEALKMKQPEASKAIETLAAGNPRVKSIIERLVEIDFDSDLLDKFEKLLPKPIQRPTLPSFKEALQALSRKGLTPPERTAGGGAVRNEKRYLDNLRKEIADKRKETSPGSVSGFEIVRERQDTSEARTFLYQQYDGRCQVSGGTFAKANGQNYFVAVSLIQSSGARYLSSAGNMLCLSADIAARVMYGPFDWLDDLSAKLDAFKTAADGGTEKDRTISIRLGAEDKDLRFTEAHFLRMKALWEEA